jgi:endonuclease III
MEGTRSMPATTNKQQLVNQVFNILKKRYDVPAEPEKRPILEHLLYAVVREGSNRDTADKAFRRLQERFFDWNELRVSSMHEVEDVLEGLPNRGEKARRLTGILQEWFELTYSFDMEDLAKKGLKEAAKKLSRIGEVNDYAVAWVMQHGLGGHAIPLDRPSIVALRRLGILEPGNDDPESLRGTVEHYVPKARGPQFVEYISLLARDLCFPDAQPNCPACPLHSDCPTGIENLRAAAEPKPRKSR